MTASRRRRRRAAANLKLGPGARATVRHGLQSDGALRCEMGSRTNVAPIISAEPVRSESPWPPARSVGNKKVGPTVIWPGNKYHGPVGLRVRAPVAAAARTLLSSRPQVLTGPARASPGRRPAAAARFASVLRLTGQSGTELNGPACRVEPEQALLCAGRAGRAVWWAPPPTGRESGSACTAQIEVAAWVISLDARRASNIEHDCAGKQRASCKHRGFANRLRLAGRCEAQETRSS